MNAFASRHPSLSRHQKNGERNKSTREKKNKKRTLHLSTQLLVCFFFACCDVITTRPFAITCRPFVEGIAAFYDESSGLWEDVWGEHMHHGYYPEGKPRKDHAQAQVDMIDKSLEWAGVDGPVRRVVDVGCGIGGSSRHMARKYGCGARGITLSPVQAGRANALTSEAGIDDVSFQVGDALRQPFDDGEFDLVWSMESGEHMPDKTQFVNELTRVCAPGGRVLIVTWCHRVLRDGEKTLPPDEQFLLDRICDAYYLPAWCSVADYARIAEDAGLVAGLYGSNSRFASLSLSPHHRNAPRSRESPTFSLVCSSFFEPLITTCFDLSRGRV